MRRIVSVLAVLVLFTATSVAQNVLFEPGKVYLKNGEVLSGYIKTFKASNGVKHISFKPGLNADARKIPIDEIDSVKVGNMMFVSGVILVDSTGINTDFLPVENSITFSVDTGLLQALFTGRKSLYYYSFRDKDLFYIREADSLILLQSPGFKFYDSVVTGENITMPRKDAYNIRHIGAYTYAAQKTTFRYQLAKYFNDCPAFMQEINSTVYELFSLYNLFKHYYTKCNVSPKYVYKLFSPRFGYGFRFGYAGQYSNFITELPALVYYSKVNYQVANSYYAGVFFNYAPGGIFRDFSFDFITSYYLIRSLGYGQWSHEYYDYEAYAEMLVKFIDLQLNARYELGKKDLKYGLFAGISVDIPFKAYDSLTVYKVFDTIRREYRTDVFIDEMTGSSVLRENFGFNTGAFIRKGFVSFELTASLFYGFVAVQYVREWDYRLIATLRLDLAGVFKNPVSGER